MFNQTSNCGTKVYSFVHISSLESTGKLNKEICGWKESVGKICIVANVGMDILENTFIASPKQNGNHWVCFVINIAEARIHYYDSLGWKIPQDFLKTIEFIIKHIKAHYECFKGCCKVESVHCEEAHSGKKKSKCNQNCYRNAPFQGPNMEICGVVCS